MSDLADQFGDRMKQYEAQETDRHFCPLLPIYARLDGKAFHTFTGGLKKPYDESFSNVMFEVTAELIRQSHALIGYTQSDEISLAFYSDNFESETYFARRIFKLTSVLAGIASAKFALLANRNWPEKFENGVPSFDCRVYTLPTLTEMANCFLWREFDATKNAIASAAHCYYSPKELHLKNGKLMQEMLFQKGVNFNDYPDFFKRGQYMKRVSFESTLAPEQLEKIPPDKRPASGKVVRSAIKQVPMPILTTVANRPEVLFQNADPIFITPNIKKDEL